ncbi:hypothetical protein LOK74_17575 [Brevibacillus humidisoli]|uniref:hypothetical protein n=1 Tax=Brevibacillus humidisoli TaxID=2895522 RepID=UPI001E59E546|nr:hypothetical protein [Brevibacillus humidisoli]UFJ39843.1 hypothetical protein LOK74_17575 [Brevibacillus humidisoli]
MKKERWLGLIILVLSLSLFGCGQATETSTDATAKQEQGETAKADQKQTEQAEQSAGEEGEQEAAEAELPGEPVEFEVVSTASEDAPEDQGNLDVRLEGEITVNGKNLIIKGQSNLLPGTEISNDVNVKGYNVWGYNEETEVAGDGSFELEIKKPDVKNTIQVELYFKPEFQSERIKKAYGENGEKLTGPYVYQYLDSDEIKYKAAAYAYVDPEAADGTKVAFETPKWDKPDDYGQPTIWIKPTVSKDEKHLYVTAKSNLLEGTEVKANIDIPDHWHYGYTDNTQVNPDGSFMLQIEHPKDVEMYYFLIQFVPDDDMWPTVTEAYGAKGEKLKGDLVKVKDTNDETVNMIEMKVKITP